MYDVIIIGSGPAGLTAAIYAARREMKALVIGKELGGQIIWASEIENYPGFKNIKNFELIKNITEQVKALNVEIKTEELVKIEKSNNLFNVSTNLGKYEGKTLILALGLTHRHLNIPGEKEFNGRGVSYCANCDGPFFKNKTIAVVGGGNAALDAAEVMSKIASQVYLIHRFDKFEGFEILLNKIKQTPNIKIFATSEAKEIIGTNKVEKLKIVNNQTGVETELETNGVFVEIGRIADTDIISELIELDQYKQIKVDDRCQTNQPGIFAAGDVTNVPYKQITVATGQGTIAALSAYEYLQKQVD